MKFFLLWVVFLSSFVSMGASLTVQLDPKTGGVEFHATGHPSAIKIVGKGSAATGSFGIEDLAVTGSATFELASLDTGIEMRTKHMKEKYLETGKYPNATLTITGLTLPKPLTGDASFENVPFTGKLSLHGVVRAVGGTADISRKGGAISLEARFSLRVGDYAIALPSFAGITMADEVQVLVKASTTAPAQR